MKSQARDISPFPELCCVGPQVNVKVKEEMGKGAQ